MPPAAVRGLVVGEKSTVAFWKFCGRLFSKSIMLLAPWSWISWAVTTWIGLVLVRFGCAMRDPVTTTSWSAIGSGAGASCAMAIVPATKDSAPSRSQRALDRRHRDAVLWMD